MKKPEKQAWKVTIGSGLSAAAVTVMARFEGEAVRKAFAAVNPKTKRHKQKIWRLMPNGVFKRCLETLPYFERDDVSVDTVAGRAVADIGRYQPMEKSKAFPRTSKFMRRQAAKAMA